MYAYQYHKWEVGVRCSAKRPAVFFSWTNITV